MVESGGTILGEAAHPKYQKLQMLKSIVHSLWPACTRADPYDPGATPFVADAIIANPPTFGHIHCAEALGVPLHMMFPQPWTATAEFPHPMSGLVNERESSNLNYASYGMCDFAMWVGNDSMINEWRVHVLKLRQIRMGTLAGSLLTRLRVPFSYMWSPSFVPKPRDWPDFARVVGAFTHDQVSSLFDESKFAPLIAWLDDGPPPIFVGFGSMVIKDPGSLAEIIKQAAEESGARVLVQSNWSKISVGDHPLCYDIGPCPHDWLLPKVRDRAMRPSSAVPRARARHGRAFSHPAPRLPKRAGDGGGPPRRRGYDGSRAALR